MASRAGCENAGFMEDDILNHDADLSVWKHLVRKDFIKTPKEFHRGENMQEYLKSVKSYCEAIGAGEDDRRYILINNLDDEVKYELFALPEYQAQCENTSWLERTLTLLHKTKTTEITPLLELLRTKQADCQTVTDFATTLRVKAFKLMGHDDPVKREKFLITAFLKGLRDRKLAAAIDSCSPENLTEAIDIAKRERNDTLENNVHMKGIFAIQGDKPGNENDRMTSMEREIRMLKEKIDYLISITKMDGYSRNNHQRTTNKRIGNPMNQMQRFTGKTEMTCFNCNLSGHLARNCRQPCKICRSRNHTSYNCVQRQSRGREHVRVFQQVPETDQGNAEDVSCGSGLSQNEEVEDFEDIYCLQENIKAANRTGCTQNNAGENETQTDGQENLSSFQQGKGNVGRSVGKPGNERVWVNKNNQANQRVDKGVSKWVQYINGQGGKPKKHYASGTVITRRRPELAANKPIVQASIGNVPVKLFCDSGAECNTIDLDLFQRIHESDQSLTVYEDKSKIKCASGALIECVGIVNLSLSLGSQKSIHPFKIIPNMFPELIGGIKLMKSMRMRVNPANDCIEVGNECVPFISKVRDEEICPVGNDEASFH